MDIPASLTTFLVTPKWHRLMVLLPRENAVIGDERKKFLKLLASEVIKHQSLGAKAMKVLKVDRFRMFFENMIAKSHIEKFSLLSMLCYAEVFEERIAR
jgi:pyrroloquinoline quinone (PQQ) biosynthesis protein C